MKLKSDLTGEPSILKRVVALLNLRSAVNYFDFLRSVGSYSSETIEEAGAEFDTTLARFFDQWIDSGRSGKDGIVETPRDRNVDAIPAGYDKALSGELLGWLTRNPPTPFLTTSGQAAFHNPMPNYLELHIVPRLVGYDFAVWWFVNLMDSPQRYRLARCANSACRTYFAYERIPRSTVKNGTFCSSCKGIASVLRTRLIRDAEESEMLGAAANAWSEWKASAQHPDQRWWVAHQVNKRCGRDIHRKWVSQNLTEILKRAELQSNAKG